MSEILLVNPSRRRRKKHKARRRRGARAHRRTYRRRRHTARRSSFRVRRVRARRNPIALSAGGVLGNVKDGAIGAVGGVANDLAFGYVKPYLPAMLQTGFGAAAAKLLTAVGVGFVGNKVAAGRGKAFAVGATTVVLHEVAKAQLAQMAPNLPLGAYVDNGGSMSLLGYDPGQIVSGGDELIGDSFADNVGEYISDYDD